MSRKVDKCPTPPKEDLTFSSTSEVKNFVRAKMSLPTGNTSDSQIYRKSTEQPFTVSGQKLF